MCQNNSADKGAARPLAAASSLGRALSLLLLLALASACGGTPQPPVGETPADVDELLSLSEVRLEGLRGARIRAVAEVWQDGQRARLRQAILLQQPGMFRIETLSPFDTTLSVVASNGEDLIYYDLQAELFLRGEPSSGNIARLVPVELSGDDLVRVLLGGTPADAFVYDGSAAPRWDSRRGGWVVEGVGPQGEELKLWFQHKTGLLMAIEATQGRRELWSVATGAFKLGDTPEGLEVAYPTRLRLKMTEQSLDLSLEIDRYDINPLLGSPLFSIQAPRGTTVQPLR